MENQEKYENELRENVEAARENLLKAYGCLLQTVYPLQQLGQFETAKLFMIQFDTVAQIRMALELLLRLQDKTK